MERDLINNRFTGKAMSSLFPDTMVKFQEGPIAGLNAFACHYLPLMAKRYEMENVESPKISVYDAYNEDSSGYIERPVRQLGLDGKEKVLCRINIDQSRLFAAQMTDNPFSLLEDIGGFLGTIIRWNAHFPEGYITFEEQLANFHPIRTEEEREKIHTAQEARKVSYMFNWLGRHVLRDVADSTWKLDHEAFETDIAPFFPKQKKEVLQRIAASKKEIAMIANNTANSKEGYQAYYDGVNETADKMLGEFGHEALQSYNPYERELYRLLFIESFPGLGEEHPSLLDRTVGFLVENKWKTKSKTTPLEDYAELSPRFFRDLLERNVRVTPEIAYERLVRAAKSEDSRCVKEALRAIKKMGSFTYFDLCDSSEYGHDKEIFRIAENNEHHLLQNLPSVVRMPDKEIREVFLTKS